MTREEFVAKYNLGVSFEEMYLLQSKARRTKNFVFKDEVFNSDRNTYIEGLKYMLNVYIGNHCNPKNIEFGVTLEGFDFAQFARDYESAKRDEFEKSGADRPRRQYEGIGGVVLDTVLDQMTHYNRRLDDVWAEFIKNGAHLEDFRSATLEADKDDLIARGYNADDLRDAPQTVQLRDPKSYVLAHMAYRAMQKVIRERTWGWRLNPFNWGRWRAENKFMSDLEKKLGPNGSIDLDISQEGLLEQCEDPVIERAKIESFAKFVQNAKTGKLTAENAKEQINAADTDKIMENALKVDLNDTLILEEVNDNGPVSDPDFELNQSIIAGADEFIDLDNDNNPLLQAEFVEEQIEVIEPNEEENEAKKEDKKEDKKEVKKEDKKEVKKEVKEEVKKEVNKAVNKEVIKEGEGLDWIVRPTKQSEVGKLFKDRKIHDAVSRKFAEILKCAGATNTNLVATGGNILRSLERNIGNTWSSPEKMHGYAKDMFKNAYFEINTAMRKASVGDKLVAAQRITDVMFNVYSPVTSKPELAKYGDNYAIKIMDDEDIQELTKYEGNVEELMKDVKVALGIIKEVKNEKESVQFNGEFNEGAANIVGKVEKHENPIKENIIE